MAEELIVPKHSTKKEKYKELMPQIEALVGDERDQIANLANIASALKYGMGFFWVGFYLVKEEELVLGPFQGPIACTRIKKGKGVCGTAWEKAKTVIVPDVYVFPGHIACSSDTRSEIVIPIFNGGSVAMVLDVDSNLVNDFDETDQEFLEGIGNYLFPKKS